MVAVAGALQPALGGLQGAAGRLGVARARVGPCLDQAEEAHGAGGGQAAVALQGGLGEVDALVGEAAVGRLEGHRGQYVAPQGHVGGGAGEAQGLDVVALGGLLLARVEGHPAGEPGEFGGGPEEGPADLVGVRAEQQRRRVDPQALRHHGRTPVAAAVLGVPAARVLGGLAQLLYVAVADLQRCSGAFPRAGVPCHRAVGRGYQPAGGGGRVRADGEGSGQGLPDAAAAGPASGEIEPVQVGRGPHRLSHVAGEGEAHLRCGVRVGQADLVQRHRAAELLPIAAAMRCGAAPCGTMPFDTQRATDVLS